MSIGGPFPLSSRVLDIDALETAAVTAATGATTSTAQAAAATAKAAEATLAAFAAGAPIVSPFPSSFAGVPSPFQFMTAAGMQVYSHNGSASTLLGWLGKVAFDTVADLLAYTGPGRGVGAVWEAGKERYIEVASGGNVVATNVQWRVLPKGWLSPKDLGAAADGVTDDTVFLQAAANACKGTAAPGLDIGEANYFFSSPLDFREVRNIRGSGTLLTKQTGSVAYVTVGTSVNSNFVMDGGDIQLFVRNNLNGSNNNNTGLSGTIGILVRGSARAKMRLYAYNAERGVVFAPQSGHYIAFNNFVIGTNGTRIGHEWASEGIGWYNQNTFDHVDVYDAGNALAGGSIGVLMNTGTPNNNVYHHLCPEGMDESIVILTGLQNKVLNIRNEVSGPARFGDGSAQSVTTRYGAMGNVLEFIYEQTQVNWQAERPNVVYQGMRGGPIWANQIRFSHLDFIKAGALAGYTAIKGVNFIGGTPYFSVGTRDDTARTFNPGSNHRVRYFVPVKKGDILRVNHEVVGGTAPGFLVTAMDGTLAALPTLASGQMSYFGSDTTPNIAGASNTANNVNFNNSTWELPMLISVNRDEVKFLSFDLLFGYNHAGFTVDKLLSQRGAMVENTNGVVGVTNLAGISLNAGQIALGDQGRVGIGAGGTSVMQIGQGLSATGAQIGSAAASINSLHKASWLMVWDTTNNRLMISQGTAAVAAWRSADGTVTVTPT